MIEATRVDDWDDHWSRFGSAAEIGPTPRYRRRLIFAELNLEESPRARVVEFGSGTGEFGEALFREISRESFYRTGI